MKKHLSSKIIIAFLLIGGITISGCSHRTSMESEKIENSNTSANEGDHTNDPEDNSNLQKTKVDYNSLMIINNRIGEINSELTELNNKINNNESTVIDVKRSLSLSVIISWVVSTLSLIIAILSFYKTKTVIARTGRHRKEIENLKQSLLESEARLGNASRNYGISSTRLSSNEYSDLSSRIYRIECQLKQQIRSIQTVNEPDITDRSKTYIYKEKTGYFDIPKQKSATEAYFECLVESRTSDSCFRVIAKNEKAEFRPLEETRFLNDIKSYDTIKLALEIQGVLLAEAKQIRVIKPGEAILIGKRWEITKKAQIELSK